MAEHARTADAAPGGTHSPIAIGEAGDTHQGDGVEPDGHHPRVPSRQMCATRWTAASLYSIGSPGFVSSVHSFPQRMGLMCRTPAFTCCRKPERRRSVGWRQSGARRCSAWNTLPFSATLTPVRLFDLDAIAHHPQLHLLQTYFPALFELSHLLAIPGTVGDIYDDPYQVVPVEN